MARASTEEMFLAATRPGMRKIFGSMDLQPCWVDTGDPHADIKMRSGKVHTSPSCTSTFDIEKLRSVLHGVQGPQPLQYLREKQQRTGVQV